MKNKKRVREAIEGKMIGRRLAKQVADSQFDLGKVSRIHMTDALSAGINKYRRDAFQQLDELSQVIVLSILEDTIDYDTKCIVAAHKALNLLHHQKH